MKPTGLRAALVGLGEVAWGYPAARRRGGATTHLGSYRALGIDCVAGCDSSAAARRRFERATRVPAQRDFAAMLRSTPVDILSICSPDALHFEHAQLALDAGVRRVWLEKPPAASATQTRRLAALARQRGATVAVNFFRRYHPAFLRARRMLRDEVLGPVRRIRLHYSRGLRANGIHQLDLLHFLTGDRREFTVEASRADADGKHFEALLRSGSLRASVGGAALPFHLQETEVLCERGRIRIAQGGGALWIERGEPNPAYPGYARLGRPAEPAAIDGNPGDRFPEVLADLLASHRARRAPRSSLATALRAMRLYEAILNKAHVDPRRGR